jgi:AraC family transcriptional regulator, regulatory protein of adaptative response / DNA-3-methyladenine glycosylase II
MNEVEPPLSFDLMYRLLEARDSRFDGQFIAGVRTTGIYCRPSCPAVTPKPGNVSFYRTAAAAHEAGLRACKRCQPDAVPGSPDWNLHDDLASRAMRLVHDGVVEREGVPGLAARLGYTPRHVTRVLTAELGAGPLALARAHRAQTARMLLGATDLPVTDIAFASGFGSLRQFNDTIAAVYQTTPTELRGLARRGAPVSASSGTITLRLPARAPFDADGLFRVFAAHSIPGFEEGDATRYARPLKLPGGRADIEVRPGPPDARGPSLRLTARLAALSDLSALTSRIRRMFDLDADSVAIDAHLSRDPDLAPLVAAVPGIRIAGSADGEEALFRTLVGQQISVAAARTVLGRIVEHFGDFPTAAELAERGHEVLRGPATRVAAILRVAEIVAAGDLPLGPATPVAELRSRLLALPGVGPWTADYLAMSVLGHPDAFPATDLVLKQSAAALGIADSPRASWAPWHSYAALHLWRARPVRPTAG